MTRRVEFNGRILEFPDDATDDEIRQLLNSAQSGTTSPRYDPNNESALDVRQRQLANVGQGAVNLVTGIPGAVSAAGGALWEYIKNRNLKPATALLTGAPREMIDTLKTIDRGLGALILPETVAAPSAEEWEKAALGAGGMLAGAALPGASRLPRSIVGKVTTPENLQLRAAANRVAGAQGSLMNIPYSTRGAVVEGVRAVMSPMRRGMAGLQEKMSRWLAKGDKSPQFIDRSPAGPMVEREFSMPADRPPVFVPPRTPPRVDLEFNVPASPSLPPKLNIEAVETAIAPSGAKAKLSTLRNTPKLVSVAPELIGVPPGLAFDAKLMEAFKRVEQGVIAAEDVVPRSVKIQTAPIVDHLKNLIGEYSERQLTRTAARLQSIVEKWQDLPATIPWDQFMSIKRAFFKEHNINSSPLRRAYGGLMEASGKVSDELAIANRSYSVVRRAFEDGKIDLVTGRRIMSVGKPAGDTMIERMRQTVK